MKTFSEKYKDLPEARNAPDVVLDLDNIMADLAALDRMRAEKVLEMEKVSIQMLQQLSVDWTREELIKAGFYAG